EFDFFPGSYSVENVTGLAAQWLRYDDVGAASDRFLRGKSEQTLGGRIPAGDDAVERLGHDRIVGGFHRRDEQLLALEGAAPLFDLLIERLGLGPRIRRHANKRAPPAAHFWVPPHRGW